MEIRNRKQLETLFTTLIQIELGTSDSSYTARVKYLCISELDYLRACLYIYLLYAQLNT